MSDPRSYLFVPGQKPQIFAKAAGSGADAIILDLEDAVGPGEKDAARAAVMDWFDAGGDGIVRINGADSPWFDDDLTALAASPCRTVMVPKAAPDSLTAVHTRLPDGALIALIETAEGLARLRSSVTVPGVARLAFGNLDFGADTRLPGTGAVLDPARFEIALAARLGDLPQPIDGVTTALKDDGALTGDIARAQALGFGAKLCIHPAQVAPVNAGFSPSKAEIDWATRVISALQGSKGAVVQIDGKMVDRPLENRARSILAARREAP